MPLVIETRSVISEIKQSDKNISRICVYLSQGHMKAQSQEFKQRSVEIAAPIGSKLIVPAVQSIKSLIIISWWK